MKIHLAQGESLYPPSSSHDAPSRKLALGILLQALRDAVAPSRYAWRKDEDWQADAMNWFEEPSDSPGSFPWVCQHLQIDPGGLRAWLDRYRASDREERKRMARELVRFQIPSIS